jgi:hypothetical protein
VPRVEPHAPSHQHLAGGEVDPWLANVAARPWAGIEPQRIALAPRALLRHDEVHTGGNRGTGEDAHGCSGAQRRA